MLHPPLSDDDDDDDDDAAHEKTDADAPLVHTRGVPSLRVVCADGNSASSVEFDAEGNAHPSVGSRFRALRRRADDRRARANADSPSSMTDRHAH
jgi:hypothetical protein